MGTPDTTAETAPQTEQKANRPLVTFRHRGISASVFENDGNSDNTYFNVSVQKRYKDKESGEWKTSSSLLRDELPVLEHLIRQAYAYILQQESADQKSQ